MAAAPRSSAWPLAWLLTGLIVYATLHPFAGWLPPAGGWPAVLRLHWTHYHLPFDLLSNYAGYVPLGGLWAVALLRGGASPARALLAASAIACGLSWALETLQHLLPTRVPSRMDWLLNSLGGYSGALLAVLAQDLGWFDTLRRRRDRWWHPHSGNGQILLLLWPLGLLFPPPVPFGLGQVLDRLTAFAAELLAGTPWAEWAPAPLAWNEPLSPLGESLAIALGLLAPAVVAFIITRRVGPRLVMMLGGAALGWGAATLSTALNFGPAHALSWLTPATTPGFALALAIGAVLAWLPARLLAGLGLVGLTSLCALVNQAPPDPYAVLSLQGWEQGRFIRFHGLAQWVGWLWPYAAIVWLLARLAQPTPPAAAQAQT
ncbi:MAG: VanZ family protein [Burkholderiales bacterium]|nr:VanZ family protein [Burkholderiales bacterium]